MTPTLDKSDLIGSCDAYLASRTGWYERRAIRYRAALNALQTLGLSDDDTVVDVGAGWTELDYCLRVEGGWRGRYIPIDGGIDGVDIEYWSPRRHADFFVALEIIEHLERPFRLIEDMQAAAPRGIIISTPNPRTTDVLGMDPTHKTPIEFWQLVAHGFSPSEQSFYGKDADSLFAVWRP